MKKRVISCVFSVFLLSFVIAQGYSAEIVLTKESLEKNSDLVMKVLLRDPEGDLISDKINITVEDSRREQMQIEADANKFITIPLKNANYGEGKITVIYKELKETKPFFVKANEEIEVTLKGDTLVIKNIGNVGYSEEVEIIIGDTSSIKDLELGIGEEISYRLIAPEGAYSLKVVSGGETLFQEENVQLREKGLTGQIIGAVDKGLENRNPLTGGIGPENEENDDAILGYLKGDKLVYIFALAIIAIAILIAIERFYSNKKRKK